MAKQKTTANFFKRALPLLRLCGLVFLICSCTKKNAATPVAVIPVNTSNTDTMPITGTKTYLALGDSYTIGTSVTETERYPVQAVALLKAQGVDMSDASIIATNGWTTADLMNATENKPSTTNYDAVSLLIGVNNQYQGRSLDEYRQQFTLLLKRSIQLANGKPTHVIVLSIPDYSVTPFASGRDRAKIAAEIDNFNAVNKNIAVSFGVQYLNVTEDSRKAATDLSLVASDGLHFSGKEYGIWTAGLAPLIKSILH